MHNIKKIKNLKELKTIPLNTIIPFDNIIKPNLIILNYSSPNIRLISSYINYLVNNEKLNLEDLEIVCIIPHKIKHYEEYLVNNLPFYIYQTTDIFELQLEQNEDIVITNKNNSLEITKFGNYEIAYLIIKNNKIEFELQNQLNNLNNHQNNIIHTFSRNNKLINYSEIYRDIRVENFRNGNLILTLKNKSFLSIIDIYYIELNKKLKLLKTIQKKSFIKSIDTFILDHNNFLIILLTFENTIEIINFNFDNNEQTTYCEIELKKIIEKLDTLDLKKIRINDTNLITWDHNTIYIFKHNVHLLKEPFKTKLELHFYNTSGQKVKHPKLPQDGIWKQTIWGNINNIHPYKDIFFIADSEYNQLRKLDITTGKSYSINIKNQQNESDKLKGKISSIFFRGNIFFIDLDFKKIKYIQNEPYSETILYDENINLFSQVFAINQQNIIYNNNKEIVLFNTILQRPILVL